MAKLSYSETLKKPLWQKKRLEILNRDEFTCQLCSDKKTELHIHHKEYLPGRKPWEYEDDNFKTLCKYCHLVVENYKDRGCVVLLSLKGTHEDYVTIGCVIKNDLNELSLHILNVYKDNSIHGLVEISDESFINLINLFEGARKLI